MRRTLTMIVIVLAAGLFPGTADATTVICNWSGTIDQVAGWGVAKLPFAVDDAFSIELVYDSATTGQALLYPNNHTYRYLEAITYLNVRVGGYEASS